MKAMAGVDMSPRLATVVTGAHDVFVAGPGQRRAVSPPRLLRAGAPVFAPYHPA